MAVTKIHPIKATLDMAIGYITNKEKTDEQILVSSFCCNPDTANLSFELTREEYHTKAKVLANHLIQSFAIGETTPEQAHAIGEKLCEEILKGQYEYVLSTHIDRGHIHNHIIFNHVSFVTGKCYRNNKGSYHNIRYQSDKLCRENNLSVIDDQYKRFLQIRKKRGLSWKEWSGQGTPKAISFKGGLQKTIDATITKVDSFECFIEEMKRQGYEVKDGKHLAFKAVDQKKFTRTKTIGEEYSKVEIEKRIMDPEYQKTIIARGAKEEVAALSSGKAKLIGNVVDLKDPKIMASRGYQMWAAKHNLQAISTTMVAMQNMGFNSFAELEKEYIRKKQQIEDLQGKLQSLNKMKKSLEQVIRDRYAIKQYEQHALWMLEHPDDKLFVGEYKKELYALKMAEERLQNCQVTDRTKPLVALVSKYDRLVQKSEELQGEVYKLKEAGKDLYQIRKNYLRYTGQSNDQER